MQIAELFTFIAQYVALLLFLLSIKMSACSDVSLAEFSVDDILNSDLIPTTLVTDQLGRFLNFEYNGKEPKLALTPDWTSSNSTDLSSAVEAMRYHRQMMNEFLLSDYLSKEIVGFIPKAVIFPETLEKRSGKAKNNSLSESRRNLLTSNHKLLEDEGSSKYSTWLKRMATLEDIQKQLLDKSKQRKSNTKQKLVANRRQSVNINFDPNYGDTDDDDGLDYLEDGDITGYAYTNSPIAPVNLYKQSAMMEGKFGNSYKQAVNKAGYDHGYDDYSIPHDSAHNYASGVANQQGREIGIKDITDIALTTLAFLSFGMFILQVLMCITMSKDDASNMVMLPMEGTDNGDIPADGNTEEIRRKRRSVFATQMRNIEMINLIGKRALLSLDAVTSRGEENRQCHYYSLCDNNKFARQLKGLKKLWIPAWSLGISWLTTKFENSSTSTRSDVLIMNSLKVVLFGLLNGNCPERYVNKCTQYSNSDLSRNTTSTNRPN